MANLDQIRNIVIVMMENRSFDHMLGYLSLPPFNVANVDGQSLDPTWLARYTNIDQGRPLQPFLYEDPYTLPPNFDPPHERPYVAGHLGALQNGAYPMTGFPNAIPDSVSADPTVRRLVMGYFGAQQVPINQFFASNFTICDRWFCSLPTGTQPNRLMAMSGSSMIEVNSGKGTSVFSNNAFSDLFGQILILAAALVPFGAVLIGPIWLFGRRFSILKRAEIERLNRLHAEAVNDPEKADEVAKDIELVKEQTTWPRNDKRFIGLMLAAVAFVAIPWALMVGRVPEKWQKWISALR